MNHKKKNNDEDTMRPEYDFDMSKAVRGKYYKRLMEEGANVVTIQPDVFKVFPDSESVNAALRSLIEILNLASAAKARRKRQTTTAARRAVKA